MKKFASLTLSLALAASLTAPAFAAEGGLLPLSPAQTTPLSYAYEITVNGEKLDTAKLPAAGEAYIPMRVVAEADHGSAMWSPEENSASFYMGDLYVTVSFADNAITIGEKTLTETAIVADGVTFLPLSVFDGLEGYTVTTGENGITLVTPNNDPLVKLAYSIIDGVELAAGMKTDAKGFFENFQLNYEENFESAALFQGFNINPDTLLIGKLKTGADTKAVEAALESYRAAQEETFSWYMAQHLEKVQNAKTIVNGDYVMFTICEDYDAATELFNAFVAEQK